MNSDLLDFLEEYGFNRSRHDENTRIYHDLYVYGDEADEFLEKFEKQFYVDLSAFVYASYFPDEGNDWIPSFIIRFLTGRKPKVYKELTVIQLREAIETKVLK